jgi:hypothetical protein
LLLSSSLLQFKLWFMSIAALLEREGEGEYKIRPYGQDR